jgi:solute carrier family 25 (mitochondrial iron transporter), member 28/37
MNTNMRVIDPTKNCENNSNVVTYQNAHFGNYNSQHKLATDSQHKLAADDYRIRKPNSKLVATSSADFRNNENHLTESNDDDDDWEEWDGKSPFWIHCTAGSIAGVIEHSATYPLDTVRTHIQVCAACIERQKQNGLLSSTVNNKSGNTNSPTGGMTTSLLRSSAIGGVGRSTAGTTASHLPLGVWQTIRYLVSEPIHFHGTTTGIDGSNVSGNSFHRSSSSAALASASALSSTSTTPSSASIIQGWSRLWRGVQTVVIGCIPAHALYFSSYEIVKNACTDHQTGVLPAWGSSAAGAVAAVGHDIVMTPLDTIKQRMQLGYHSGVLEAIKSIVSNESYIALYRSFPVTLATNIPYGMIMVTTNETCKTLWMSAYNSEDDYRCKRQSQTSTTFMFLTSSSIAGLVASAVTTPLDRIKTSLQTQQLAPNCVRGRLLMNSLGNHTVAATPSSSTPTTLVCRQSLSSIGSPADATSSAPSKPSKVAPISVLNNNSINNTWYQAAKSIYASEGSAGFFRGIIPRVLSHTPAVAISWTAYESVKQYLVTNYHYD